LKINMKLIFLIRRILHGAYLLISLPALIMMMFFPFYNFFKAHGRLPVIDEFHDAVEYLTPHCFFIDFFLIAFGYLYFVN